MASDDLPTPVAPRTTILGLGYLSSFSSLFSFLQCTDKQINIKFFKEKLNKIWPKKDLLKIKNIGQNAFQKSSKRSIQNFEIISFHMSWHEFTENGPRRNIAQFWKLFSYITIRILKISFRNCVSSLLITHYRTFIFTGPFDLTKVKKSLWSRSKIYRNH